MDVLDGDASGAQSAGDSDGPVRVHGHPNCHSEPLLWRERRRAVGFVRPPAERRAERVELVVDPALAEPTAMLATHSRLPTKDGGHQPRVAEGRCEADEHPAVLVGEPVEFGL